MKRTPSVLFALSATLLCVAMAFEPNYDESLVPSYELPDPLVLESGDPVATAAEWATRRTELLSLFAGHVYGETPMGRPDTMRFVERKTVNDFLDGKAVLREVRILLFGEEDGPHLDLLVIAPAEPPTGGAPAFLCLNFSGNHSIHPSPEISLPDSWMRAGRDDVAAGRVIDNRATEAGRGFKQSRWAVEDVIDSGMALATFYYGDIDPDFDDGFENGIHATTGQPGPREWGSIGSWAWGCSRALDYLESDSLVDAGKVAVFGHSRLGKTALWAGAQDERFALVISNNSGCGGAALSRRAFGETVGRINTSFPHWFSDVFPDYNENEPALPVDQHQLIALIAPRPVYIASATEDRWADPKGEFLAALHADPVYRLLGTEGLGDVSEFPAPDHPVGATIRYHLRTGKHDVTSFDWKHYIRAMRELVVERGKQAPQ